MSAFLRGWTVGRPDYGTSPVRMACGEGTNGFVLGGLTLRHVTLTQPVLAAYAARSGVPIQATESTYDARIVLRQRAHREFLAIAAGSVDAVELTIPEDAVESWSLSVSVAARPSAREAQLLGGWATDVRRMCPLIICAPLWPRIANRDG